MDFSKLKTNSSLDKLAKKIEESEATKTYTDDRYWQPAVDKAGNGSAVIRLLPTTEPDMELDEDAAPFVKYFDHNFKGPGGWYIERCLTTLGQPDPCAEYNNQLWNSGVEANKNIARDQKRNTRYVSNILVVSDSAHPENDGKEFLYRYGPKLFEKFQAAMTGDEDTPGFNPWNFWTGANFRIKIKTTKDKKTNASFRDYGDSKFAPPSVLSKDDDELKVIWSKEYPLHVEIAADKFKSYADLKVQLNKVLAIPTIKSEEPKTAETTTVETKPEVVTLPWDEPSAEDTTLSYFEKLAADV